MLEGDQVGLGRAGAGLLGNEGAMAMIHHHPLLYADLADPVALVGTAGEPTPTTRLGRFWPYCLGAGDAADADELNTDPLAGDPLDYSALMGISQSFVVEQVLGAYAFDRHRRVLDLGGGVGRFARAVLARHPKLAVTVLDLPEVAERAAREAANPETGDRSDGQVAFVGGDFLEGPLPEGADLITLVRVLHDHDDGSVRRLLRNVHAALPPGGRVLVAEPMGGMRGVDAYFACYFLAMGQGRLRSRKEIRLHLKQAGFRRIRECRTRLPLMSRVLIADR